MSNAFKHWAKRFGLLGLGLTALLSVLGFLGDLHWFFDLWSHFRWQYAAVLFAGALILYAKGQTRWSGAAMLLALANIAVFVLYVWPAETPLVRGSALRLKILHANVLVFNRNYDAVADLVRSTEADVLSLQEISPEWQAALQKRKVLAKYPYQLEDPASGNILASRLPLRQKQVVPIQEGKNGSLVSKRSGGILLAQIRIPGQTVQLVNMHPAVPVSGQYAASYDRYLSELALLANSIHAPVILIGDLNTTPWSAFYRHVLETLALKDAKRGRYRPTWPTFLPLFYLPIDHVFVSPGIETTDLAVGPMIGSDHYPVIIELALPEPGASAAR